MQNYFWYKIKFSTFDFLFTVDSMRPFFVLVLILGLELNFFISTSVAPPREQKTGSKPSKAEGDNPRNDEVSLG